MGRLAVQHFQQPALVVRREAPCVPVHGHADRVAVDQLATIGGTSAQRRQPAGDPPERRHDLAVAARDQRQHAPHRQSVIDQAGGVSRGQELRDVAVNRGETPLVRRREQPRGERASKDRAVRTGTRRHGSRLRRALGRFDAAVQDRIACVRCRRAQRAAVAVREEQRGAQASRGIDELVPGDVSSIERDAVLLVRFLDHRPARALERLAAAPGPVAAGPDDVDQHG